MVTKYTANEYGDFFVASIQEPYHNVVYIRDWTIVAGVKKRNMTGNVTGSATSFRIYGYETQFDTSFAGGDSIIIGNVTYVINNIISDTELTVTEPIQYNFTNAHYYTIPDNVTFFDYEFRWSTDGKVFSEFVPLNHETGNRDIQVIMFDHLKPLYIDVKSEVAGLAAGNTLTFLSIEFSLETEAGIIESCPNYCTDCTDPFAMNGCANIQVSCNTTNQFNPYALTKSVKMYKQLVNIVNGIFGHNVTYFKTEPDLRTTDVILMEYSLHNVVDKQTIKILVPDNEFPSETNTYDIFGIELNEFEVHITAEEFQSHFGPGKYPRNKDYMYVSVTNEMYEINSVALADEFNKEHSYWRVKLVKYQDRGDVIKGQFDVDTDVLITGIEEVFGERIQDEYKKNLKPEQFQTVIDKHHDGIRTFVDRKLRIVDYALKNRWTVVSKNHYDFSNMILGASAVIYEAQSELKSGHGMAFTSWFKPQFASNSVQNYRLIGDTDDIFKITISNTELIVTTPFTPTSCITDWMTTNFDSTIFKNGDPILQATNSTEWADAANNQTPTWCYYNFDSNNGPTYGKLYNWYVVGDPRGIGPVGYIVPSESDWTALETCVGSNAGGKLKTTGTIEGNDGLWYSPNAGATDEIGFSGIPAGVMEDGGNSILRNLRGGFWTTTLTGGSPMVMNLNNGLPTVYHGNDSKAKGYSIRLKKDIAPVPPQTGIQSFTHGITFNPAKWYGYVVNINNEFLQMSASIYSLDSSNNMMLPQSAGNNLTTEFTQTVSQIEEQIWTSQAHFELQANQMLMTNIRVFNTPIEFEQHLNILNQYVVRDNQLAIIIDNAIPTIGFQKYANAR